ncbi:type II secretion system F family protein [Brevibacillus sp. NPDC003359]|uniref:type II secretion system F family protein n=1 Tax=unclassified Brevibacillus TaxID=2684853 RepID=UPI0036834138
MKLYMVFWIIGTILLMVVFYQISKRFKKKSLALLISEQENIEKDMSDEDRRKRRLNSFRMRAERVNWLIPPNYQQTWAVIGFVIGGIGGFVGNSALYILAGIAFGLFFPFFQLKKREEAFQQELPLRAEQAINAVEQQMQADIPIFHAIKAAVPYMQSPLKEEYQKAVDGVEKAGMGLQKALEDIPIRLDLPQLEYFHMIVEVAEETQEKAREIVRDCSDLLRRQQKNANRYLRETSESRKEMNMMFGLVVVMVGSFTFMLPSSGPLAVGPIQNIMDGVVLTLSAWITWTYRKKLNPRNLF